MRATYHYAYPAERSFSGVGLGEQEQSQRMVVAENSSIERLYHYDPQYIRQDLKKTLIITTLMIAAEVLYFLSVK